MPVLISSNPAWAQVAQLVEHCTENAGVGGSIPPLGTKDFIPINDQIKSMTQGHFFDLQCGHCTAASTSMSLSR
jgi:hypothetical protein